MRGIRPCPARTRPSRGLRALRGAFGVLTGIGLIPACAGSTIMSVAAWGRTWAHPRMRGEHAARPLRRQPRRGLIAACAGSTSRRWISSCARRAHPRMRGEHNFGTIDDAGDMGSSPHARGARKSGTRLSGATRLIPACAGSTGHGRGTGRTWRAHPRMRGEHAESVRTRLAKGGSSPHARGARLFCVNKRDRRGLIPACAGSTELVAVAAGEEGARPRMRGEHFIPRCQELEHQGPSPHARGALLGLRPQETGAGIIPACAGSILPDLHVLSPLPQFSFTFTQLTRRNPPPDTSHLRRPA